MLLLNISPAFSQHTDKYKKDSGKIDVRTSDKAEKYKNDKDFNYDEEPKEPNSLWEKIVRFLLRILDKIFSNKGIIPYIRNTIIFIIIVIIVIKLFNLNYQALFSRTKKSVSEIDFETYDEEILSEDLDKIINAAIADGDFRLAVRFLYLKLLKLLNNNGIIEWEKNKTNKDYRMELEKTRFKKPFGNLTYLYEYVWYGNFMIEYDKFNYIKTDFENIYSEVD